jgi:hypothetical protein
MTLEQQLREYTGAVSHVQRPISAEEAQLLVSAVRELPEYRHAGSRGRAVWVTVAAAVAVLLVVGAVAALFARQESSFPPATDPAPPTTEAAPPTTEVVVRGDAVPVSWVRATGAIPAYRGYGTSPVVTNGSSYLGVAGSYGDRGWSGEALVRSDDGIEWEEVGSAPRTDFDLHSPIAAGTFYLLGDEDARNTCSNARTNCTVLISSDGLAWDSQPWSSQGSVPHDWVWRVQDESTIRRSSPEDLELLDAFESVVMEFPDRLIQFGINHIGHGSEYRQSTDIGTWTQIEQAPPFASTLTADYLSAGWQSMWRCEFTAHKGQGMALIGTDQGLELWTTNDGVAWDRLPNPPVQTVGSQRGYCIHSTDQGWILAPGGRLGGTAGQLDGEPVTAKPQSINFSSNGTTWSEVEFSADVAEFEGLIEVAGNTIYIFDPETADVLVGTIQADGDTVTRP